jgi:hypothetical protein
MDRHIGRHHRPHLGLRDGLIADNEHADPSLPAPIIILNHRSTFFASKLEMKMLSPSLPSMPWFRGNGHLPMSTNQHVRNSAWKITAGGDEQQQALPLRHRLSFLTPDHGR